MADLSVVGGDSSDSLSSTCGVRMFPPKQKQTNMKVGELATKETEDDRGTAIQSSTYIRRVHKMSGNPLRPPARPFMKRPVKREGLRPIPPAKKEEVYNPDEWKEYTLKACTQADIEEVRTHIIKFQSKQPVDPRKFHLPIRLHRKETKNLQYQLTRAEIEQRQRENAQTKLEAEAEVQEQMEAKQQAIRDGLILPKFDITKDANVAPEPEKSEEQKKLEKLVKQQKNIAPDGGARRKVNPQKRKTRKLHAMDENAKKLRYEEYYPWVMEDYDGSNTWVGQYDASSADHYCLMYMKGDEFIMVPSDKVYKFTPRNKYATLTLEEAEARLQKHNTVPRWLMKHLDENEQKMTRSERTKKKLKTVEGSTERDGGASDHDDLDFDEEFADDEEAPIMEGNEDENKESERRIKREMLTANALGLKSEDNADDDVDDLFEVRKVDKDGERVRKTLIKTEAGVYDSDEDLNPYLNESDLEAEKTDEELITADLSKPVSPSGTTFGSRAGSPSIRRIRVKSYDQGFLVLKASPDVLKEFPPGEWNPQIKKRSIEPSSADERETKRVKLEPQEESVIKLEENPMIPAPAEDNILTAEDVIAVVKREGKVTAKSLILSLKSKLSNPENKARVKVFVKQLLKNDDGFLVLKNENA
ncbi:CYFA0S05e03664g1_1 [Cyberlindnera fabianii]|uniref:Transcription initiation factor IIF subunit alpha n=1 Tax=Cyberlindnera fabianii TaxID=36022 RepID=A0A061AU59_CYBFA|nr:CYFA0S05e03664g1_1 [Cyberlindnera fabianii]